MQKTFDNLYEKSKKGENFSNLLEIIQSKENILLAFRNIKGNKGSKTPGVNGKTMRNLKKMSEDELVNFIQSRFSNYFPKPVRRCEITEENGKIRPLGIPCIEDRLIQQCIKQVLEPICEAKFHQHSYGFRPNRSTKHAVARAYKLANLNKMHYVVDIDIKGFFDNVDHGKLLKQMWSIGIKDKRLLSVISKILKCPVKGLGVQRKGTPQGGILSPLLSNIVLNELDWWLSDQWLTFKTRHDYGVLDKRFDKINEGNKYRALRTGKMKEFHFVRYADDFKIFCKTRDVADRIFYATREWLKERLKLEISEEKSKITNIRKKYSEFLGIRFKVRNKDGKWVVKSNMTKKAVRKVKNNLKDKIKDIQRSEDIGEIYKYNSMIMGCHNYYNMATAVSRDFKEINYVLTKSLECRLKNKLVMGKKAKRNDMFMKFYGDYKNGKVRSIKNITLFPIYGCVYKTVLCFSEEINNYTETGRKLIHDKLNSSYNKAFNYLINNVDSHNTVEYNDNRLSLFVGQRGKCFVTNSYLEIGEMECHHKKPKHMGGSDEYNNLVWINKDIHKLIHCTDGERISYYINKLNEKTIDINYKKLNRLRMLVGNNKILV